MLTMFFSLFINKIVGTAIVGGLVVFMFICQNQLFFMDGVLRFFSPVTWMRVMWSSAERYGIPVLPSTSYIFFVLIGFIVTLECLVVRRIKKVELHWEKEEG
jgi:hypothetical protein